MLCAVWASLSGTLSALIWTASYLSEPILSESGRQRPARVSIDRTSARVCVCLITAIMCVCLQSCSDHLITSTSVTGLERIIWLQSHGKMGRKIPNEISLISQTFLLHRNEIKQRLLLESPDEKHTKISRSAKKKHEISLISTFFPHDSNRSNSKQTKQILKRFSLVK